MSLIDRLLVQSGVASPWADNAQLTRITGENILGLPEDLQFISRATALSLGVISRGRNIITGTIAGLPLISGNRSGAFEDIPSFLMQPEVGRPRFQTILWTVDSLLFHGVAYWKIVERGADDRVKSVEYVQNSRVTIDSNTYRVTHVDNMPVADSDIIRIDGANDGLLTTAAREIRAALALRDSAVLASSNPTPTVELHQTGGAPLQGEKIKELLSDWISARKKYGTAYTSPNLEVKTHGAPPEQLLIEGRKAISLDLARAMSLPAWAIDAPVDGSSMTYSNTPSRSRELVDYALKPYMEAIAARLSMDDIVPRGQWVSFNTDPLLRGDFQARLTAYKTAIEIGLYTPDEIRKREALNPQE